MASYYVRATGGSDSNGGTSHADGWATMQHALDTMTTGQKNRLNCSGSFTLSSSLDFATYGSPTVENHLLFVGYTSTEGDGGICSVDCGSSFFINNNALNTTSFQLFYFNNWGANFCIVINDRIAFDQCEFDGEGSRAKVIDVDAYFHMTRCKIHGIAMSGTAFVIANIAYIAYNYFQIDSGVGGGSVFAVTSQPVVIGNVVSMNTTQLVRGIYSSGGDGGLYANNTVYNQAAGTGEGIEISGSGDPSVMLNNLVGGFSGAGGKGYEIGSSRTAAIYAGNRYYNCTSGLLNSGRIVIDGGGNTEITSNPFKSTGNAGHDDDDFETKSILTGWPSQLYDPDSAFGDRNLSYPHIGALAPEFVTGTDVAQKIRRVI